MIKIQKKITGNCDCMRCGKSAGNSYQPYTLWYRADTEKRGHNYPVCSIECAKKLSMELVLKECKQSLNGMHQ